jgi:hypothetical protein
LWLVVSRFWRLGFDIIYAFSMVPSSHPNYHLVKIQSMFDPSDQLAGTVTCMVVIIISLACLYFAFRMKE